jgi:hypothetical protein
MKNFQSKGIPSYGGWSAWRDTTYNIKKESTCIFKSY